MTFIDHAGAAVRDLSALALDNGRTALALIDMQGLDADRRYGIGPALLNSDTHGEANDYFTRVENVVVPALGGLLDFFRARRAPIAHVRICGPSEDGREAGWRYAQLGIHAPRGSREAAFIDALTPRANEAVIDKITSSAFISTNLDSWLRSRDISSLVVGGVVTNGCVESTVRVAADIGYRVWMVEDGCAALSKSGHDAAISHLHGNYARVVSAEDVLGLVDL